MRPRLPWWDGFDLPGKTTLQGRTFELGWDPIGRVEVFATIVAPTQAETATLTTLFTWGVFETGEGMHQLEGRGTATASLGWNEEAWEASSVRHVFGDSPGCWRGTEARGRV
jgi:hypothetical protein